MPEWSAHLILSRNVFSHWRETPNEIVDDLYEADRSYYRDNAVGVQRVAELFNTVPESTYF